MLLAALLALLLVPLAACAGDDSASDVVPPEGGTNASGGDSGSGAPAPGVSDDVIRISLSGPYSTFGDFYRKENDAGFGVWLNQINAEGGIHGRRVEMVEVDNALTADGAIAACEEEKDNDTLFTFIAAGYAAESTCLEAAGVPSLVNFVDQVDPNWTLVHYIGSVSSYGATMADLIDEAVPNAKVGVMFLRDLAYGFEGEASFTERAKEIGLDIVATEGVATGQASFVPELQRIRSAGANALMMFITTDVVGVLRDAKSIDFRPRLGMTGFVVDTLAQTIGDPLMGVLGARSYGTVESPAFADYVAALEKYGNDGVKPSGDAMGGYGLGLVLQAVLEAAGPDPTRESVLAGITGIDGLDTGGIFPPISWKNGAAGTTTALKMVCCDDQFRWLGFGAE